jgi:PAS domain S-box-containing protein
MKRTQAPVGPLDSRWNEVTKPSTLPTQPEASLSSGKGNLLMHEESANLTKLNEILRLQETILKSAPITIIATTVDGIITLFNGAAEAMLGYKAEEIIGHHSITMLHDPQELLTRALKSGLQTDSKMNYGFEVLIDKALKGEASEKVWTLVRRDGSRFPALISSVALHDEGGTVTGFLGIALDMTERIHDEQALRIAAAAFEVQEGIMITDAHKTILRVNQAFSRITGYSTEEVIGKSPSFLRSGLHDDNFYQRILAALERDRYWQGEIWDSRKNGEVFPVLLTITAVTQPDGNILNYVGSFVDITAQKQVENILLDARLRLESQVKNTKTELENIKNETSEVNAALRVMLKYREEDKCEAQNTLSSLYEGTILPIFKKLKTVSADQNQIRLIKVLENNLNYLVQSYGRATNLNVIYQKLTPIEVQVAALVRQGLPTKLIAKTLSLSPGTIGVHRKHIRKKLGLAGEVNNLRSYLLSME